MIYVGSLLRPNIRVIREARPKEGSYFIPQLFDVARDERATEKTLVTMTLPTPWLRYQKMELRNMDNLVRRSKKLYVYFLEHVYGKKIFVCSCNNVISWYYFCMETQKRTVFFWFQYLTSLRLLLAFASNNYVIVKKYFYCLFALSKLQNYWTHLKKIFHHRKTCFKTVT